MHHGILFDCRLIEPYIERFHSRGQHWRVRPNKDILHTTPQKNSKNYGIYSSLEKAFEFCWSLFADEQNTLPKSTRRKVKLNKFAFGTP